VLFDYQSRTNSRLPPSGPPPALDRYLDSNLAFIGATP